MPTDLATMLDPMTPARRRKQARRAALRGTSDWKAYAQMLTDYYNELNDIRGQLLNDAKAALEGGLPTAADFARDCLEHVARIDREMRRMDPRRPRP